MGRATLLEDSPERLTGWLRLIEGRWWLFAETGGVLRRGEGIDYHGQLHDAEEWRCSTCHLPWSRRAGWQRPRGSTTS